MRWFRNIKANDKFLIIFGCLALLATGGLIWSVFTALGLQTYVRSMEHQSETLATDAAIQSNLLKQQVAVKNFLLTGSPYYLSELRIYQDELQVQLDDYHLLQPGGDIGSLTQLLTQDLDEYQQELMDFSPELGDEILTESDWDELEEAFEEPIEGAGEGELPGEVPEELPSDVPGDTPDLPGSEDTPDLPGGDNTPDLPGGDNTPDLPGGDMPDLPGGDDPDLPGGDLPDFSQTPLNDKTSGGLPVGIITWDMAYPRYSPPGRAGLLAAQPQRRLLAFAAPLLQTPPATGSPAERVCSRVDSAAIAQLDQQMETALSRVERKIYRDELVLKNSMRQADEMVFRSILVASAGLAALIFAVALVFVAANQITDPLRKLSHSVVAFENDTFKPETLREVRYRRDELGQMARSFTEMSGSISESIHLQQAYLASASRFIPTQYLDFLEKDSITQIRLGDHVAAEMAVMFSDVRGFTTLSESMTPQQNFDFVNEYLKLVSPIIEKHNGFVVKFLGDGMMAIFPYGVDDAVRAGIEKQQKVQEFSENLVRHGFSPIQVGIGVHTGHMMVGMIGDELRMQGDAFSDNVNLTSRVEGLTKYFGVSFIITEETLMRLETPVSYGLRYLGKAQVKGREKPIALYEVYDGESQESRTAKDTIKEAFELGLKQYLRGQLDEACQQFARVLDQSPEDRPARIYFDRCQEIVAKGVPADWDGVEIMTSK